MSYFEGFPVSNKTQQQYINIIGFNGYLCLLQAWAQNLINPPKQPFLIDPPPPKLLNTFCWVNGTLLYIICCFFITNLNVRSLQHMIEMK